MTRRFGVCLLLLLVMSTVQADNWPQLRGPNSNGSSDERKLPTSWSRTENVAWRVDMPGPSAATPIIWGDNVFVSSTDLANDCVLAMCVDRRTGKLRWQNEIASRVKKDYRSTFAAPTPVTDGKRVIFFYGTGDMVCFDVDGKQQWKKNMGPFAFLWTFSTSPILADGKLILQVLQRDTAVKGQGKPRGNESYLLAMDPASGNTIWRHVRPSKAQAESLEAFSTPVVHEYEGRKLLLVAGGDCLTAHELKDGHEVWRWGTWNPERIGHWRLVPSPVAGGGVVLACAPKGGPIFAVKQGGSGKLSDDALAWVSKDDRRLTSDVPTPAFYDGDFFVLSKNRRALSRVNPKTGESKWSIELKSRTVLEASPTVADNKIYLIDFDGNASVLSADTGKVLKVIPMEDNSGSEHKVRSSIAVAGGQLFIRTNKSLFCIGK